MRKLRFDFDFRDIAYRQGWISADKMRQLAQPMLKNKYGKYLLKVIDEVERTGNKNLD